MGTIDIGRLVRQIPSHYPFVLVDRVLEHDPAGSLLAVKNVTGGEDFFAGHFDVHDVTFINTELSNTLVDPKLAHREPEHQASRDAALLAVDVRART